MRTLILIFGALVLSFAGVATANAQNETYTGTVISYGTGRNVRTYTNTFTLRITGQTSDTEVDRLVGILQESGQDELLKSIDDRELGRFSIGAGVGRPLNAVRIDEVNGKKRIRAIFARWMSFGEIRGGYRSVDYPFGYLELLIDPETGKGDGTFIEAAQIRWKRDKGSNEYVVEIENFGTFPARLMGVQSRGN